LYLKSIANIITNEKYYLGDALHNGIGKVSYADGRCNLSFLIYSLLAHLKARHRCAKTIISIVDNSIITKCETTKMWLKTEMKLKAIYQPVYAPCINAVTFTLPPSQV